MKTNYKTTILLASLSFIISNTAAKAQSIACGGWHSLAICADSTVKGFGENATGELGNGATADSNIPVTATGLTGVIAVSAGGDQLEAHSLALKKNGTVWAWGSNIYGGLGNGTTNQSLVPAQVLLISGITAISAGGWHSVALKNDGTVWAWGWNTDGQIGDGTTVDKTIATQVSGLTGVKKISAGTYHVLALKSDSTVWAWGDNAIGQIGDGTTTDKTTPVQVTGLTGIVSIASGRFFSLAVKRDGTVWTWGENMYGQLGNGNTVNSSVPVQVSGLTGITSAVAATGAFHCMAVKNDGTIWAWGRNTYGNLGDGTVAHRSTPVQMTGITNATGLAAGTNFSLLYKSDGTLWGCGRNASGQLCDGTFLQRNTVVQSAGLCSIMQAPVGIVSYDFQSAIRILAFPNPSNDGKFSIKISDGMQLKDCKIEVFNSIGEKIIQSTAEELTTNSSINIDLSSQANGVYYLTMKSGENVVNQKLMKQ